MRRGRVFVGVALCLTAGACGGDGTPPLAPTEPDTVVDSVWVAPPERSIGVLGTQFEVGATALNQRCEALYGTNAERSSFKWSSSAPEVATVGEGTCVSGPPRPCLLVTGVGEGTATISATTQGVSGSMTVTVRDRARPGWSLVTTMGLAQAGIAIGPTGTIYAGMNDYAAHRSLWYAVSPEGTVLWTRDLPLTGSLAPAIADDGTLYLGSWSGEGFAGSLIAVGAGGAIRWVLDGLDGITSSPAIGSDGTLYAAGGHYVYAVDPSGEVQWSYRVDDDVFSFSSPAIAADGTLYVGARDNKLYAIDRNGLLRWTFD